MALLTCLHCNKYNADAPAAVEETSWVPELSGVMLEMPVGVVPQMIMLSVMLLPPVPPFCPEVCKMSVKPAESAEPPKVAL